MKFKWDNKYDNYIYKIYLYMPNKSKRKMFINYLLKCELKIIRKLLMKRLKKRQYNLC